MQEPCRYLTPYQQIEYYNHKSIWRLVYRLENKWSGMSLWDMFIWLGGGVNHQHVSDGMKLYRQTVSSTKKSR